MALGRSDDLHAYEIDRGFGRAYMGR
jgi:hypothetical protein